MDRDREILWTHQPPITNQWRALKRRFMNVMWPLSHVFISVYHEASGLNLLLDTSEKMSGSQWRICSKTNAKLFQSMISRARETWCAAAGPPESVLLHNTTWLNDDIYELLHVEIAERRRNEAPSLLSLSVFIVRAFCFQMANNDLFRCSCGDWTLKSTLTLQFTTLPV